MSERLNDSKTYIAIDLKSFYASVECRERGLDPLTTNLVVADASRTEKTICLAVSPSLKQYGISGRARLFEVVTKVKEVNASRLTLSPKGEFTDSSIDSRELLDHPEYALDYIAAPPRMALYIDYSTRIYNVYLKYIAPEDIHVYSIDEVFMDVTDYLKIYHLTPLELARKMIKDVLDETGITATAGIGTNMYLAKIAMDIVAKHMQADEYGVRIAELDERKYREYLWTHEPLTDFWRVGRGYVKKLHQQGIYTMGDIARCSLGNENDYYNEELLYKMFGVNAELLIDHAWGYEPCTIAEIKAYRPEYNSLGMGQVLQEPYDYKKGRLVLWEMADMLALDLVDKGLVTDQLVLTVGYDVENLTDENRAKNYKGEVTIDGYGRRIPKHAHGTKNIEKKTSSSQIIIEKMVELFDEIVDENLLIRRINLSANKVISYQDAQKEENYVQLDLFSIGKEEEPEEDENLIKERKMQEAMLSIKKKYGKNAILKGKNLSEGATSMMRNRQIGGHKA